MSNSETSQSRPQESIPDLYKLLGLTPLESDTVKIERAISLIEKKAAGAEKTDPSLSQRAARIVALSKKNLIDAERKRAYDRAWTKTYGSPVQAEVAVSSSPARQPASETSSATASQAIRQSTESSAVEMEWDLSELESLLPAEDPRAPFDLGSFLSSSASLPETNPTADYEKLQSFLGGTATAVLEAPRSVSATELMRDFSPKLDEESESSIYAEQSPEQTDAPKLGFPTAPRMAPGGIAKQIRRKRNRAMLLNIASIAAVFVLVFGGLFYYVMNKPKPAVDGTQLAQVDPDKAKPKPKVDAAKANEEANVEVQPGSSGLPKVAGLDGEMVVKPDPMQGMMPENTAPQVTPAMQSPSAMTPNESMMPPTASNNPPTPPAAANQAADPAMAASTSTPPTNEPATEPATEPAAPPADPELTAAEKLAWSKAMKETLKTLGLQNFKLAKEQLAASSALAKTQLQKEQHKRLDSIAKLTEEFHGFLVEAVTGLDAAETFKVGRSLEASFIEGNETSISVKIRGQIQTFALTELQIGLAMGLVDLKMDTEHPNSLARKAAFALVHPKTNGLALKAAREQMVAAAAAGAVEADMPNVFDEDYSLK